MVSRAEFWIGLLSAAIAFSVLHGIGEYRIACKARTYVVFNGVEQDLTPAELVSRFLIDETLRVFPLGVVAALLLCLPLSIGSQSLRDLRAVTAYSIAAGGGALAGGFLSFAWWMTLGGWGPPALIPTMASGTVLAAVLVAARRSPGKDDGSPPSG